MSLLLVAAALLVCCMGQLFYPKFKPHPSHAGRTSLNMDAVGLGLFVGDQHAAGALPSLREQNISGILNVAWDLDIRYDAADYVGDVESFDERLEIEFAKVGLVDGLSNLPATVAAAVLFLHQMRTQNMSAMLPKDQNTFPPIRNILVHCHSGQSRSVTVAALYLFYSGSFSSFQDALDSVKNARHLSGWPVPEPHLIATALQVVARYPNLLTM